MAELKVEAKFLKQKQLMEQESKEFQLNLEMAKSQAKIQAYETAEQENEESLVLKEICPDVDKSKLIRDYVQSYEVPKEEVPYSNLCSKKDEVSRVEVIQKSNYPGGRDVQQSEGPWERVDQKSKCPGGEVILDVKVPRQEVVQKSKCPGGKAFLDVEVPRQEVVQKSKCPGGKAIFENEVPRQEVVQKSKCPGGKAFLDVEVPRQEVVQRSQYPGGKTVQQFEVPREIEVEQSYEVPEENMEESINRSVEQTAIHRDTSLVVDEILRHMQAPPVEMSVFSGNIIDYPLFIATFAEVVESKITNPRGRLVRLIQYLRGEAKELAESCSHLPSDEGYERAKLLLDKQYGDKYRILSQYRNELKYWPKLKSYDAKGFRRFYSFLLKYKATMLSLKTPSFADSPETIQKLQLILPPHLQERWNRKSYQIRRSKHKEASLDDFIMFVEEETALINDPTYSRLALQDFKDDASIRKPPRKDEFKNFRTAPSNKSCQLCKEAHDLDKCEKYLKFSIDERRKWLYKEKLCYGCYGPTSESHQVRTCRRKRKCEICGGEHPTGLHGFRRRSKQTNRSNSNPRQEDPPLPIVNQSSPLNVTFAKLGMEVTSLNVVLVRITHPTSKVVVTTKALLDNGSQGTFIHEKLLEQLKVKSMPTSISVQTMNGLTTEQCKCINNLEVYSFFDSENKIRLPRTFSREFIPVDKDEIPSPSKLQKWKYLDRIHPFLQQDNDDLDVGLLIGGNCPRALEPVEVIPSKNDGPYAFRSNLGWCVTGPINVTSSAVKPGSKCNFITFSEDKRPIRFVFEDQIKENGLKDAILHMLHQDFTERANPGDLERMSIDDKKFLELMDKEVTFVDGHYQLPLPFRNPDVEIPNNKIQAIKRARSLKRKLQKDKKMYDDYCAFMNKLFDKSYAKKVDGQGVEGKTWYLPHHGVYHPKKPEKIRVVFDCSATYGSVSLNSMLLQGPDLTNRIVGVLSRFREEQIALVGDIESMFYQVRVPEEQQDMLRFVWWPEGNLDAEPEDYRMCVHLFGGTHSPSVCNYALRRTAIDNESKFGQEAASTLFRNFYVDDMLKGASNINSTVKLLHNTRDMCASGGFNLTQFMSSSREVLEEIPSTIKAKGIKDVDLSIQSLPIERALGVSWCVETDSFCFRIVLRDTPLTRRGILASVSSVYDPLGFGAPFVLPAKRLLQQICSERKSWDDEISPEQRHVWEKWRQSLHQLQEINIQRCIVPSDFGDISEVSFHHFSDASTSGYGQVSYTRLVNQDGRIHCSFMIGKARVAPLKPTTVPRLELTAATTSTKVATQMKREMTLVPDFETFWTDSKVVLGYISNQSKKFHLFVTNRIQAIHDGSDVKQWRYVPSDDNPSDDGSRGKSVKEFVEKQRWINGPEFLWKPLKEKPDEQFSVDDNDVEVKKTKPIQVNASKVTFAPYEALYQRISNWYRLKRIIAAMLSWKFKKRIDVDLLRKAELAIVRLVQKSSFPLPIEQLKKGTLARMDPFIDDDGIIRVGGRITNSTLPWELKHPIIMPKKHRVSILIIRYFHQKVQHGGRDATLNEIRQNGFMIVNANSHVRNEIYKCVICRRFRGKFGEQKMANLPSERCSESAPFTYSGVDMFGPFIIKQGRKELKRYVALFTCFASRAIHLESTTTLDTDTFILALRRFINRRGDVREIRSDNGSNFVGADSEFKKAIKEMDQEKIKEFLMRNNIDWMGWDFNTPTASHMGGVWERQIRSCRSILSSLLKNHSQSLNDESFYTVLTEVETIVNSRPLSVEVLSDSNSLVPLTPNQLLTSKTKIVMAPPGKFTEADIYSRRRWRRVQHLVNEFWSRWRSEYLQSLQQRRKWIHPRRNFAVGDVIVIKDDATHRNEWRLGRITAVKTGDDQNVRSVVVQTSTHKEYERPISKIVLLVASDELDGRIPDEEPYKMNYVHI